MTASRRRLPSGLRMPMDVCTMARSLSAGDSRISGKVISDAVKSGLRKAGCDVIDLGLATHADYGDGGVTHKKAAGGVIITASHNPARVGMALSSSGLKVYS